MLVQTQASDITRQSAERSSGAVVIPRTNWLVALGGERIRTIFDAAAPASTIGKV